MGRSLICASDLSQQTHSAKPLGEEIAQPAKHIRHPSITYNPRTVDVVEKLCEQPDLIFQLLHLFILLNQQHQESKPCVHLCSQPKPRTPRPVRLPPHSSSANVGFLNLCHAMYRSCTHRPPSPFLARVLLFWLHFRHESRMLRALFHNLVNECEGARGLIILNS